MPRRTTKGLGLAVVLVGLAGCGVEETPAPIEAPEPIGSQLRQIEGTWTMESCASSRMYWDGRRVQYQCYDRDGNFSWENRGVLTQVAIDALEGEIANAELEAMEPVNYNGLCGSPDAGGTITLWVEEEGVSFAPFCLFEGIVGLYEQIDATLAEIASCDAISQFESVEPGCRAY